MRSNQLKSRVSKLLAMPFLAALLMTSLLSANAQAEIIILESNAPELKSGQVLPNDAKINIPAGKRAQLILPSGKTKTLNGPFSGTVSSMVKGENSEADLFRRLMDMAKNSGRDDSGFAAVRRVGSPGAMSGSGFSWTSIPADSTGSVCVAEGKPLVITRPRNISLKKLKLRNTATNKAVTVAWKAGDKSVPWPDSLLPKNKKSHYGFKLDDRNEKMLTFHLITRDDQSNDNVLRTLYHRGCQKQLQSWLRDRLRN